MQNLRCPSCGAPIKKTDTTCTYCGAYITEKEEKNDNKRTKTKNTLNDIADSVFDTIDHVSGKIKQRKNKEFNWLLFIILCILFVPGAIIYLLIYMFGCGD